nr:hypothetical protein GCM10017611_65860 [Rhodococcus wratislaviensis]
MTNNHDGGASGSPDGAGPALTGISIAVVAVSTTRSGTAGSARTRPPWVAMEDYAALIRERTPMRALCLPVTTSEPHILTERGPVILTELDVLTAAVAAATITTLRRRSVPPRAGRVVVTGASWAPLLAPVLIASGVGDLSSWHKRDAEAFPLRRLMEHNDVLVDPSGCAPTVRRPGAR